MAKNPKKAPTMGPVRTNLEAFGAAILAAVLLKWFCIEAYQIPTSSMQPTLMGDTSAGVYDRILVDKLLQTIREPKRWDITVFKYPLQKNQNYVKRIGGMPGDRLYIAGGNLYQVTEVEGRRTYAIIRKPDDLQAEMWKNLYPARRLVRAETKAMPNSLYGTPGRAFTEDDQGFVASLDGSRAALIFTDKDGGGCIDRVWDGYPEAVARAIRNSQYGVDKDKGDSAPAKGVLLSRPQEIVPDVRIAATVTTEKALDELAFEIEVLRPGFDKYTYAFVVHGGKGVLQVRTNNSQEAGRSPEFAVELAPGTATRLSFAHVDDELIAWRDGVELQRFDTQQWACREGCVLPFSSDRGLELPDTQKVNPQIVCKGQGKVRFDDLRIDRDQHYTRLDSPEIIEVPEGHYYMLGDNTLQSIDSRGWTAITIGVDKDNRVVPPDTPGARIVRGNKRAMPLGEFPDRDETPIGIPSEHCIVMIDEYGEILRLSAEIGPDWPHIAFELPGAQDGKGEWIAPETRNAKGISFVPRADIQGRAVLVFYPSRPLAWLFGSSWPGRFGFVR
ncbi:MAG TPA: signal peptidase I [Planctomycetota bacterium]|nr:signal peptidase I [Planctomycetota bacterium]